MDEGTINFFFSKDLISGQILQLHVKSVKTKCKNMVEQGWSLIACLDEVGRHYLTYLHYRVGTNFLHLG